MTETENVKALECCGDESNCAECPLKGTRFELDHSCAEELMKLSADRLKRAMLKNEELQHEIKSCNAQIDKLKGRIESVEYSKQKLLECFKSAGDIAIKKFVKRLKEEAHEVSGFYDVVDVADIDNLVKEMEVD